MVEGAKYPRRITIWWGPLEDGYATHRGLLFDGKHAMHINRRDSQLWLDRVVPVEGLRDTYTNDHDYPTGIVLTEHVQGGEALMKRIYAMLTSMTAFDFATQVIMPAGIDLELFPEADPA